MKIIYWNTKEINGIDRIIDLIKSESPQLIFLSEIDPKVLTDNDETIYQNDFEYYPNPGCERVHILKNKNLNISLGLQNRFFTVININEIETYIISVHLPSQYFRHFDALKEFIRDFRAQIDIEIGCSIDTKVLIIGDFNVSPFEQPMIGFDGFGASNSRNSREKITYSDKLKTTYYNPTWELYSRTHFPGTIKFNRPSGSSYDILEHHYLDQVILSRKLLNSIKEEKIDIIENTKNFNFLLNNKVTGSDHLPISYKFKLK